METKGSVRAMPNETMRPRKQIETERLPWCCHFYLCIFFSGAPPISFSRGKDLKYKKNTANVQCVAKNDNIQIAGGWAQLALLSRITIFFSFAQTGCKMWLLIGEKPHVVWRYASRTANGTRSDFLPQTSESRDTILVFRHPAVFHWGWEGKQRKDAPRLRQRAGPFPPIAYGSPDGPETLSLFIVLIWYKGSWSFHNLLYSEIHTRTHRKILTSL